MTLMKRNSLLFNAYFSYLKADILEMGIMPFNDLLNETGMGGLKI